MYRALVNLRGKDLEASHWEYAVLKYWKTFLTLILFLIVSYKADWVAITVLFLWNLVTGQRIN